MKKEIYEAWEDPVDNSVEFATVDTIKEHRSNGTLGPKAKFLHRIEASSYEEAMTLHYQKMGYEPYKPHKDFDL